MIKVGLTGNIGSGKSAVSKVFEVLRVPVYLADDNAKLILDKPDVILQLKAIFGEDILTASGIVDRKKLAAIVFADEKKLSFLNGIIHPALMADFEQWASEHSHFPYVVMESAILYESGKHTYFDNMIVVTAQEELRIQRVMQRDHASREEVLMRMKNQLSEGEKIKLADFRIVNDKDAMLTPQVIAIHHLLLSI